MKKRLFIAIPLSESWLNAFSDFQKRCDKEFDLKDERDFRWTKVDNLHITICFLGWVDQEWVSEISHKLKKVLSGVKPLELEFENIIFGPPKTTARMIWGMFRNTEEYKRLAKLINEVMQKFSEEVVNELDRDPIAHITLARFKDGRISRHEEILKLFFIKENILKIDNIQLMESRLSPSGSTYLIVEKFILK